MKAMEPKHLICKNLRITTVMENKNIQCEDEVFEVINQDVDNSFNCEFEDTDSSFQTENVLTKEEANNFYKQFGLIA